MLAVKQILELNKLIYYSILCTFITVLYEIEVLKLMNVMNENSHSVYMDICLNDANMIRTRHKILK